MSIAGRDPVCIPRLRRRPRLRRLRQRRPRPDHARNEGQDGNHRPRTKRGRTGRKGDGDEKGTGVISFVSRRFSWSASGTYRGF